nr:hypothetical protein BaRGS_010180 [Batillaria attramentaria]
MSTSVNALAQVYSITVDQLMQLLSGKTPSQIATVGNPTQTLSNAAVNGTAVDAANATNINERTRKKERKIETVKEKD